MDSAESIREAALNAVSDFIYRETEVGSMWFRAYPNRAYVKAVRRELNARCKGTAMRFKVSDDCGRIRTADRTRKVGVIITRLR